MTQHHRNDPRPFLSVIAWPTGATRESMAKLLATTSGLDEPTLRLRLGQAPPAIVGQVQPDAAQRAIDAIQNQDGDAFAVTLDQLAAQGPAKRVRSMKIGSHGLTLELWSGESEPMMFRSLRLLVHAMLRERVRSPAATVRSTPRFSRYRRFGRGAAAASLGAAGLAMFLGGAYLAESGSVHAARTTTTKSRNKLHIHDAGGTIYEIEGRRFDFDVLGEMKQYDIRANMDQLCELLSHLAPDEIVDPYFPLWKPPPGHHRLRIAGDTSEIDRAFSFYSRWVSLMYHHIQQRAEAEMFDEG